MDTQISIDGSMGEGGGQVLRTALALSMALGKPFRMANIRANRPKPGLKRQHLTCVRAAQAICEARVRGDAVNAGDLEFFPGPVRPGDYTFHVGTGGSVTLVLQALVPPLLLASAPSRLTVTGGTHVPFAPPFEFMRDTLFPRLESLGVRLAARMDAMGYMQTGGGSVTVDIVPAPAEKSCDWDRGEDFADLESLVYSHNLPEDIAEREALVLLAELHEPLGIGPEKLRVEGGPDTAQAAGNMVLVTVRHGRRATVFGECGWKGRTAEKVARQAARRARCFIRQGLPVEEHLADQLLVPLALAGGGSFVAQRASSHLHTCLDVIGLFLPVRSCVRPEKGCGTHIALHLSPAG